jgi:hypothetical protein
MRCGRQDLLLLQPSGTLRTLAVLLCTIGNIRPLSRTDASPS